MGNRRHYLIQNIVRICRKLDAKGFVANHEGNVSVRFDEHFLATPTSESKADINDEMIITLDQEGKKVEGIGKPFSEMKLHLAAYRARPEAAAVVHAHPPFSMARGLCGSHLEINIPEAVISIGHIIPCATFAMPGDSQNDEIIFNALSKADIFLMPGNGVLSIGSDLDQAYLRLELLEHVAKTDFYARQMGEPMQLSEDNLATLLEKRAQLGLGPQSNRPAPEVAPAMVPASNAPYATDLRSMIADEIRKAIKGSL